MNNGILEQKNILEQKKLIGKEIDRLNLNNKTFKGMDEYVNQLTIIDETILKGFYACLNFFYSKKTRGGFLSPVRRNIGYIGNEIDSMQKKFFNNLGTQFSQFNIEHIITKLSTHIYSSLFGDFFLNSGLSNDKKSALLGFFIKKEYHKLEMIKTGGKKTSKNKSNKKKKGGTGFEAIVISGIIIGAILALIQIYEKLPAVVKDIENQINGKANDDDELREIHEEYRKKISDNSDEMKRERERYNIENSSPNNRRGFRSLPARMPTTSPTSRRSPTSPTSPVRPTSPTSPTSPKRPENKFLGIF